MPTNDRIDNFFAMQSARSDRWRDALTSRSEVGLRTRQPCRL